MDRDAQQGEATQDISALEYSSSAEPRSRSELRGVTGADLSHTLGGAEREGLSVLWPGHPPVHHLPKPALESLFAHTKKLTQ